MSERHYDVLHIVWTGAKQDMEMFNRVRHVARFIRILKTGGALRGVDGMPLGDVKVALIGHPNQEITPLNTVEPGDIIMLCDYGVGS